MEHRVCMGSGEYLLTIRTRPERGAVIDNSARGQTRGPWGAVLNCPVTHVIRDAAPAAAPPFFYSPHIPLFPHLWNKLPHSIQSYSSLQAFNTAVHHHLLSSPIQNLDLFYPR